MWIEKREKLFIGNTATIRRRTKRHRHRKYLPWSEELPDEIRNYEEEYTELNLE